ncbi:hypothetical protein RCCGE510_25161 (plasmid) [Rhizobium sp. CCGE 510]|nr:hypothetical protein RCCGE510_25161 [Rhizobium sp. CCGE 510]
MLLRLRRLSSLSCTHVVFSGAVFRRAWFLVVFKALVTGDRTVGRPTEDSKTNRKEVLEPGNQLFAQQIGGLRRR